MKWIEDGETWVLANDTVAKSTYDQESEAKKAAKSIKGKTEIWKVPRAWARDKEDGWYGARMWAVVKTEPTQVEDLSEEGKALEKVHSPAFRLPWMTYPDSRHTST